MNREEIKMVVLHVLKEIAPEMSPEQIEPDTNLREQLDIDSMDALNFIIGLHHALDVDIPEADYTKLSTLNKCIDYVLAAKTSGTIDDNLSRG